MKTGIEFIAEECKRQTAEGLVAKYIDKYQCGELTDAAVCYATRSYWRNIIENPALYLMWPFGEDVKEDWGLADSADIDARIEELAKAGALIALEIDRLKRL